MTPRISLVAVCCSNDSVSSWNNRTFSMAMTAWSAKVWSKADLLIRKWPDLVTTNLYIADRDIFPEEGNAEGGSMPALPCKRTAFRKFIYLSLQIPDVEQSPFDHGSTTQRSAVK